MYGELKIITRLDVGGAEISGVENAGVEIAGGRRTSMEREGFKKCVSDYID